MGEADLKDVTIIGAGPTGLFGAFYAGMRGASCRVIDSLPSLGGQLMALYPEKYIYDVAGFPRVLAKDLVDAMGLQALQFGAEVRLHETVTGLRRVDGADGFHFDLQTDRGSYPTRTLLIAAGIGAFEPRKLEVEGLAAFEGRGVEYTVTDPRAFEGKRVLIVGGGDSAFDWTVHLQGVAQSVMLIHRRDGFRAHAATIRQVEALRDADRCEFRTFWEIRRVDGGDRLERVTIFDNRNGDEETLAVDAIIPLLGFHSDLGAIREWGLDTEKADIRVDQTMATNVPGIWAAGDITTYPGKLKLIATGVAEACIAVNNAVHFVNPKLKVNPGHSTNLKIFQHP